MMGMHWFNWVGLLMSVIFLIGHEPLFLLLWDDFNIVWVVAIAIYVITAVALFPWERTEPDEPDCLPFALPA